MFLIAFLLILAGCSSAPSTTSFTGTAMTIEYRVVVGETLSPKQRAEAEKRIQEIFEEVHELYNKFNPHSEISLLNNLKAGKVVPLSPKLQALLFQAEAIVKLTRGKFDPTIEPLQKLWKDKLNSGTEPSLEEINVLKPALGWDKIHLNDGTFSKDHDLTSLDLGGIAKGYCVDLLIDQLKKEGYRHLFVEWGGNTRYGTPSRKAPLAHLYQQHGQLRSRPRPCNR